MPDADHLFQMLCHEAVVHCGGDTAAVERYVRQRLAAMDDDERRRIERDVERVLAFKAPEASDATH